MYLLIDDVREGGYADIVARNACAGKAVLEELSGCINELGIDHDLGGETSGYDVVRWALARGFLPNKVQVVSLNPPGRKAIINVLLDNGYQSKDNTNFVKGE